MTIADWYPRTWKRKAEKNTERRKKRIDAREREKKNASVHVGDVTPL